MTLTSNADTITAIVDAYNRADWQTAYQLVYDTVAPESEPIIDGNGMPTGVPKAPPG